MALSRTPGSEMRPADFTDVRIRAGSSEPDRLGDRLEFLGQSSTATFDPAARHPAGRTEPTLSGNARCRARVCAYPFGLGSASEGPLIRAHAADEFNGLSDAAVRHPAGGTQSKGLGAGARPPFRDEQVRFIAAGRNPRRRWRVFKVWVEETTFTRSTTRARGAWGLPFVTAWAQVYKPKETAAACSRWSHPPNAAISNWNGSTVAVYAKAAIDTWNTTGLPNGSIQSDPAVNVRLGGVRLRAGSLPIESYRFPGPILHGCGSGDNEHGAELKEDARSPARLGTGAEYGRDSPGGAEPALTGLFRERYD